MTPEMIKLHLCEVSKIRERLGDQPLGESFALPRSEALPHGFFLWQAVIHSVAAQSQFSFGFARGDLTSFCQLGSFEGTRSSRVVRKARARMIISRSETPRNPVSM